MQRNYAAKIMQCAVPTCIRRVALPVDEVSRPRVSLPAGDIGQDVPCICRSDVHRPVFQECNVSPAAAQNLSVDKHSRGRIVDEMLAVEVYLRAEPGVELWSRRRRWHGRIRFGACAVVRAVEDRRHIASVTALMSATRTAVRFLARAVAVAGLLARKHYRQHTDGAQLHLR